MKTMISTLVLISTLSLSAFGAESLICKDGIGSQIIISTHSRGLEYRISGPATQYGLSWQKENPSKVYGYELNDGSLILNYRHQRSDRFFTAQLNDYSQLVVYHQNSSKVAWVFQNCWER